MTKRSPNFEKRALDKYLTPYSAVVPLLPHLNPRTRFVEPCAGDGRLARHLHRHGHQCIWACDVAPEARGIQRMNALDMDVKWVRSLRCSMFITNPPWSRPVLHELIATMQRIMPAWLLFDADWIHTEYPAKHGKHCAKIVSVGRVKWIEGTDNTGFDNVAWYYFDPAHRGPPRVFWRQ